MDRQEITNMLNIVQQDNAATVAEEPTRKIASFSPQDLAFIQTALLHRMVHYANKLDPLDYACHDDRRKIAYLRQQYNAADALAQRIDAHLRPIKDSAIPIDYTRGKNKLFKS